MQKISFRNPKAVKPMTSTNATAPQIAEDIRTMIVDAGGGRGLGETYEQMVWRAARALSMPFTRAWAYFYRKIKRPPADEYLTIRRRWEQIAFDRALASRITNLDHIKETAHERICQTGSASPDVDGGWLHLDG